MFERIGEGIVVGAGCSMVEVGSESGSVVEDGEGNPVTKRFSSFSPFTCPPHAEKKAPMTKI